tara:strand:+ start:2899 stop:3321 length:423 start_codon:yes stop_codon:yes gene_type:complete
MRINKLIGALGNLDQIAEGIKNRIFKRDDVEAVAKMRWMECKVCPLLDTKGSHCAVNGTQPCCADCGCSIALKIRAMSADCPKGRWKAIMPEEMEDELKKQLYLNMEETDKHRADVKKRVAEQNKKILEDQKNKKDASNI